MFKPNRWQTIWCKNCGKKCRTELKANLCSIPCILEWREEEKYHESQLAKNQEAKDIVNNFE